MLALFPQHSIGEAVWRNQETDLRLESSEKRVATPAVNHAAEIYSDSQAGLGQEKDSTRED